MTEVHARIKKYIEGYADIAFHDDKVKENEEGYCSEDLGSFLKGLLNPDPNLRIGPGTGNPNPMKHVRAAP